MNYRHRYNSYLSTTAVTWWESYTDDRTLLLELSARGASAKQQTIEAYALGAEILALLYEGRDKLDGIQLRADELAKSIRLASDGGKEG